MKKLDLPRGRRQGIGRLLTALFQKGYFNELMFYYYCVTTHLVRYLCLYCQVSRYRSELSQLSHTSNYKL